MFKISSYYDIHPLLTRNSIINCAIGPRGDGKTYSAKTFCIDKFIKSKDEFIYLRRYEPELKKSKHHLFDDISQLYPNKDMRVFGSDIQIAPHAESEADKKHQKWQNMGYALALSNANDWKSVPFPRVKWVIFDEFIIEKGMKHYIPNEIQNFLDFYSTLDRNQDRVRVIMLANAVSIVNPYFIYWGIKVRDGEFTYYKNKYISVELINNENFTHEVKNTRFGKFISDSEYGKYAIDNRFKDDTDTFIAKKPQNAMFHYGIKYCNETLGLWLDVNEGNYFVNNQIPNNATVYALTKQDLRPNIIMVTKSMPLLKQLKNIYMQSCVYFSDTKTKGLFMEIMTTLGL